MERIREENQLDVQSPAKKIYIPWEERIQDDTNARVILDKDTERAILQRRNR
jgi:hypothetical protein